MAWIYLIATIFIPIFVSFFLVALLFGKGPSYILRFYSVLTLDTKEGLIKQGLLWFSILTPVLVSLCLGCWVWVDYMPELSGDGFKKFIEISILPIAVMSLALPLAGLVSKFHSTQQTAAQIKVVSFKNNLDAFYAHRKELISYFDLMGEYSFLGVLSFKYKLHPVVHLRFFDGTPEQGVPTINTLSFEYIRMHLLSAADKLNGMLKAADSADDLLAFYLSACRDINKVSEGLHITEVVNGLAVSGVMVRTQGEEEGYDISTVGTTGLHLIGAMRFARSFFDALCDFSGEERIAYSEEFHNAIFTDRSLADYQRLTLRLHEKELFELIKNEAATYDALHPVNKQRTDT